MNEVLHTKWGTARVSDTGYYKITSSKEGYHNKKLHRLIYEDFYGVELPSEISIHHKDGDKLNNCILNLEAMMKGAHHKHHNTGNTLSEETKVKMSKSKSQSKYYRVAKHPCNRCVQGFTWKYRYVDEYGNRKSLSSVSIDKLKEKVISKGLEWIELDEVG